MAYTRCGLVLFTLLMVATPAAAGRIERAMVSGQQRITIVDHGGTRGRPAIQVRRARGAATSRDVGRTPAESTAVQVVTDTEDRAIPNIDVMAAETTVAVLAAALADATDLPAIGVDPTAYELRLLGAVPSHAARRAAEAGALELTGEPVRNELRVLADWEPNPYLIYDDEHVRERVIRALLGRSRLHAADIEVEVNEGITTLTGAVATADDRALASTVTDAVPGVYLVQNRLGLQP